MLLTDDELKGRIESPMNLMNRLKSAVNPHKTNIIPSLPPTADDIIADVEDKIKNGSIRSKASGIMSDAMDELRKRLPSVEKPEKLAAIAAEMGKVVSNIESKNNGDRPTIGQVIIYAPQQVTEEHFNVVELVEQ